MVELCTWTQARLRVQCLGHVARPARRALRRRSAGWRPAIAQARWRGVGRGRRRTWPARRRGGSGGASRVAAA